MPRGRPKKVQEENKMSEELILMPYVFRYLPISKSNSHEGGALTRAEVEQIAKEYVDVGYRIKQVQYTGDLPEAINVFVVFELVDAA